MNSENLIEYLKKSKTEIKCTEFSDYYSRVTLENYRKNKAICKGKIGVYIFRDLDKIVYIGKGGTSRNINGKDLRFRINQELGVGKNYNTLSRNIITNKEFDINGCKSYISNLFLEYYIVSDRGRGIIDRNQILKTEALESFLIATFNPEFNK